MAVCFLQAMLSADHEKMETDVKSLQEKLEQEKARFRKMQTDLQKELMGAFDENTKLTALLDGKVPKSRSYTVGQCNSVDYFS